MTDKSPCPSCHELYGRLRGELTAAVLRARQLAAANEDLQIRETTATRRINQLNMDVVRLEGELAFAKDRLADAAKLAGMQGKLLDDAQAAQRKLEAEVASLSEPDLLWDDDDPEMPVDSVDDIAEDKDPGWHFVVQLGRMVGYSVYRCDSYEDGCARATMVKTFTSGKEARAFEAEANRPLADAVREKRQRLLLMAFDPDKGCQGYGFQNCSGCRVWTCNDNTNPERAAATEACGPKPEASPEVQL
jgi:hypothetical protein